MRDIRFKAKRIDNSEWVEGYYYKECDNTYIIEDRQKDSMLNRNEAFLVDPSTVCQFTGMTDKDGKEVWEHDILKYVTEREVIISKAGIFLKKEQYILSFMETTIKDGRLVDWSNQGSKFDRKEGEK